MLQRLRGTDQARGHVERLTAGNVKISTFVFVIPAILESLANIFYIMGLVITKVGTVSALEGECYYSNMGFHVEMFLRVISIVFLYYLN